MGNASGKTSQSHANIFLTYILKKNNVKHMISYHMKASKLYAFNTYFYL